MKPTKPVLLLALLLAMLFALPVYAGAASQGEEAGLVTVETPGDGSFLHAPPKTNLPCCQPNTLVRTIKLGECHHPGEDLCSAWAHETTECTGCGRLLADESVLLYTHRHQHL